LEDANAGQVIRELGVAGGGEGMQSMIATYSAMLASIMDRIAGSLIGGSHSDPRAHLGQHAAIDSLGTRLGTNVAT